MLDILVIDMVSAEDGQPISSTRIRKGEIDKMGNLIYWKNFKYKWKLVNFVMDFVELLYLHYYARNLNLHQ